MNEKTVKFRKAVMRLNFGGYYITSNQYFSHSTAEVVETDLHGIQVSWAGFVGDEQEVEFEGPGKKPRRKKVKKT